MKQNPWQSENLWVFKIFEERENENSSWLKIIEEIRLAQSNLLNRQFTITAKRKEPSYVVITFAYDKLTRFEQLKSYCWPYGFVVPVMANQDKKILRGEKRVKFFG